jgi:hypothetical protein
VTSVEEVIPAAIIENPTSLEPSETEFSEEKKIQFEAIEPNQPIDGQDIPPQDEWIAGDLPGSHFRDREFIAEERERKNPKTLRAIEREARAKEKIVAPEAPVDRTFRISKRDLGILTQLSSEKEFGRGVTLQDYMNLFLHLVRKNPELVDHEEIAPGGGSEINFRFRTVEGKWRAYGIDAPHGRDSYRMIPPAYRAEYYVLFEEVLGVTPDLVRVEK